MHEYLQAQSRLFHLLSPSFYLLYGDLSGQDDPIEATLGSIESTREIVNGHLSGGMPLQIWNKPAGQ